MNTNYNTIQMRKRDYFALPPSMRQLSDGPMVLAIREGRETFVRVFMLE